MLVELAIGFSIGCVFMAWLLRSTLKTTITRWEREIKKKGVEEYISQNEPNN